MASIGVLDASEMTIRDLNARLKKASKTEDLIEITNPGARHNIAVGTQRGHHCRKEFLRG